MKYLLLVIIVLALSIVGCSNSKEPPIEYMNKQSHLSLAEYDSVEYYKVEKSIWNFPAKDPFTAILYFKNQRFQKLIRKVEQDTSYHKYQGKGEPQKAFTFYFEKYLSPAPKCSMDKTMYRHDNYYRNNDVIIIFCNRVYFKHSIKGPFD